MIIAIDGPAGSGKSTIAREVAKKLGMRYLDTGAMYRAVTLVALEEGLVPNRIGEAAALASNLDLRFEGQPDDLVRVFLGDREVSDDIRGPLVSQHVSAVSAVPSVREALSARQREAASNGNVVIEGRDIGTVVVPEAEVKVFLTASPEERARRRQAQLEAKGIDQSLDDLLRDIQARDRLDSQRKVAPLKKAKDSVVIDTTGMSIAEVVDEVSALARKSEVKPPKKWLLSRMQRGPLDTLVYRIAYFILRPLWGFFYRIKVVGVENFPLEGPVIVACNHKAMIDPFVLGSNAPRMIHYMAKSELWKFKPLAWAMERFGTFPVNRGEVDREAIKQAIEILDTGEVLGLFPEGHCNKGEELLPLRPGISLFSLRQGVVTIPAVMRGTNMAFKDGIPHFPKIDILYGPPISMPGAEVPRSDRARVVTELVEAALKGLLATPVER